VTLPSQVASVLDDPNAQVAVANPTPKGTPRHVAIIMDGNGRWAKAHGRPRTFGHKAGVEALRRTVEAAGDFGLKWLTVYAFSTENWRRPRTEIETLFGLVWLYVESDLERLVREGVRLRVIGKREGVPPDLLDLLDKSQARTAHNTKMVLTIAFNYGGQDEIVEAARALAIQAKAGQLDPADITEAALAAKLGTVGIPDPDLVIRTSGEKRLSNFLIWQSAYAELIFTDVLWPDFGRDDLGAAIDEFRRRERRYGGVQE